MSGRLATTFLRAQVRGLWSSPHVWTIVAALAQRGAGFLASFMVARWLGPASLGFYSVTVNTAAAVVQPVLSVFANGATLGAIEPGHHARLSTLWWACARRALLVIVPMCCVFAWGLHASGGLSQAAVPVWLLGVVGLMIMLGSLTLATSSALLAGVGHFLPLARSVSLTALGLVALSWPLVVWGGIQGALILAALTAVSVSGSALLHVFRYQQASPRFSQEDIDAGAMITRHLLASTPGAFALILQGGVGWLCTIYLVQRGQGIEALAVLAIATQWLTVMLMPVTSWSGMVIHEIIRSHTEGGQRVVWAVILRLVRRNLTVTVGVVSCITFSAVWIEKLYGLSDQGLSMLIWSSAAPALIGSIFMIFERLYVCLQEQHTWLICSAAGLMVQLGVTWMWVDQLLWVVPLGLAAGYLVTVVLAIWRLILQRQVRL